VRTRWTTRCCSAVALTALTTLSIAAQATIAPTSLLPLRTVWTLALNNQITYPPAYDEHRAFFAIEHDRLVAYDLATGMRAWLVSAQPRQPLATGDGLVFISERASLRALRAADGTTAWTVPMADALSAAPVWDNGWLVIATEKNDVIAFRAADGQSIWRQNIGSPAHARPALAADRVYVPTADSRIVSLKVDTGAVVWARTLGGPPNDILALDERIYAGSEDNFLYSLLAPDGRIDWRWRTGADVIGQPVISGNLLYFLSLDNVLRALHRTSGVQRWRAFVPLRPIAGPVKAIDAIIVTGGGSTLAAYALTDGKPVGDIVAAGDAVAPPYVHALREGGPPMILTVGSDIAKGATVTALTPSLEPETLPLGPLPGTAQVDVTPGPR
jgi:outer membrane protein assembly factor BamB